MEKKIALTAILKNMSTIFTKNNQNAKTVM